MYWREKFCRVFINATILVSNVKNNYNVFYILKTST